MPKRTSLYRHKKSNSLAFEKLEDRRYLAATIYVDFGLNTGDFTVSDSEVAALGGPEIFGDSYVLESDFTTGDLDYNGVIDVRDRDAFIAGIMNSLEDLFEPFDVDIKRANASSFSDIAASLNAQPTNDTYIFVAGESPADPFEFGKSLIDTGNSADNLGFVFAKDLRRNPGLEPIDIRRQITWSFVTAIAKQTGHTFGLESIEPELDREDRAIIADIMNELGTNADGEPNGDKENPRIPRSTNFTNGEHPLIETLGVSAGTQNSYLQLIENIGATTTPGYFVSGYGNVDVRTTETGIAIDVNDGETILNLEESDVQDGLTINGGAISIGHHPEIDITLKNIANLEVDPSLSGTPDAKTNWTVNQGYIPALGEIYYGTVNDNITFGGYEAVHFYGGDNVDEFTLNQDDFSQFTSSSFFDAIGEFEYSNQRDRIDSKGGDDIFNLNRTGGRINTGDGNDIVRSQLTGISLANRLDMGDGYDTFELSADRFDLQRNGIGFGWSARGGAYYLRNHERTIFVETDAVANRELSVSSLETVDFIVDGNRTLLIDKTSGHQHEVINASKLGFRDDGYVDILHDTPLPNPDRKGNFWIRSTAEDLTIEGASFVQLSSEFDSSIGTVSGINHDIHLIGDLENFPQATVVVSDRAGTGFQSLMTKDFFAGVNGHTLYFDNFFVPILRLEGSDTAPDYVAIASSYGPTILRGNGGNDFFTVGYPLDSNGETTFANLNLIKGNVNIDTGEGEDLVKVEDRHFANIQVQNNWLVASNVLGDTNTFGTLRYDNVEGLRVDSNWHYSIPFTQVVWPSTNTYYQFNIQAIRSSLDTKPDTLDLVGIQGDPADGRMFAVIDSLVGENTDKRAQIWIFNNGSQPIRIERFDTLQN